MTGRLKSNPLLAGTRAVLLIICTIWNLIALFTRQALGGPARRRRIALEQGRRWATTMTKILGVRWHTTGPTPPPVSLLAPNHLGYGDILPMMAATPCMVMTRTEITTWPFIGFVVRAADIPVIQRKQSRDLKVVAELVAERLRAGFPLCVFLEGTSTGGDRVLPFRAPVVQGVVESGQPIVPVGLRWSGPEGLLLAEDVAYWKDHEFLPHLWRFLGLRGLTLEIRFGDPIPTAGSDRKAVLRQSRDAVCALSGLPPMDAPDLSWEKNPVETSTSHS
ncbi:hypothetical protein GC173_00700 [bacterium]|nr:hypothetical protein [bacterium]